MGKRMLRALRTRSRGAARTVAIGSQSHAPAPSYQLPATSYPLPATGYQLPATGYQLPATRFPLDCGIMIGVGAAFDIHAGNMKDAPRWMQNAGLHWFYRLCQEPRRLWRRYAWIVPSFLWLAFLQVMGLRKFPMEDR